MSDGRFCSAGLKYPDAEVDESCGSAGLKYPDAEVLVEGRKLVSVPPIGRLLLAVEELVAAGTVSLGRWRLSV